MEYLIQAIETKKVARPDEKVARPDATPTSTKASLAPTKFKDQHLHQHLHHSPSNSTSTIDKKMIQAQKAKRALALTPLVAAASKPTELTAAGRIRVTTVRLSAYRYGFFFSSLPHLFFSRKKISVSNKQQPLSSFQIMLTCANFLTRRVHSTRLSGGKSTCLTRKVSTVAMQSTFLRNICNRHLPPLERKKITITQIRLRLVFFAGSVSSWDEASRLSHRRSTGPGTAFLTTCQYYARKPPSNPTPFFLTIFLDHFPLFRTAYSTRLFTCTCGNRHSRRSPRNPFERGVAFSPDRRAVQGKPDTVWALWKLSVTFSFPPPS